MELQELKEAWGEYDKKLEKSLRLNTQVLRKILFDKARFRMKALFIIKIAEMCWLMFLIMYLTSFVTRYLGQLPLDVAAIMMGLIVLGYFVFDIVQLSLMIQLQMKNNEEAISIMQKKLETLKYMIVTHLKYSLFLIPLYPLLMILIGKIFLNVDFFSPHLRAYLITNVIVGIALLPPFIWLFIQLSKKDINKEWVKNLLSGSGWHLANDAEEFLNEIAKFEQEG